MLKNVNLSLSVKCSANCVYCPEERGKKIKTKDMSLDTVKEVLEQIKDFEDIDTIQLSENGDCFLNKNILEILRYIKKTTNVKTHIFTNFSNVTEEISDAITKEDLVGSIGFNLDGMTEKSFKIMKGLSLKKVLKNLEYFIKKRNEVHSPIPITGMVITLKRYISTIVKNYNCLPQKLNGESVGDLNSVNDEEQILKYLQSVLKPNHDFINKPPIIGWAEKEGVKNLTGKGRCPFTTRIKSEIFVAPSGDVYNCCLDCNAENVLSNVHEKTIKEILLMKERVAFIEKISTQDNPCKTIISCQILGD